MAIVDSTITTEAAQALAANAVDYIQLRDLDASAASLQQAATRLLRAVNGTGARVLLNTRADIALATGAHGVHLRSHPAALTPAHIRELYKQHRQPAPIVSIACHTLEDITRARTLSADIALFGPVFEKELTPTTTLPGIGLDRLAEACRLAGSMPVLALGGVNESNTPQCLQAGAAGIAAIRLFA